MQASHCSTDTWSECYLEDHGIIPTVEPLSIPHNAWIPESTYYSENYAGIITSSLVKGGLWEHSGICGCFNRGKLWDHKLIVKLFHLIRGSP